MMNSHGVIGIGFEDILLIIIISAYSVQTKYNFKTIFIEFYNYNLLLKITLEHKQEDFYYGMMYSDFIQIVL